MCKELGRFFIGIEIVEKYYKIAGERIRGYEVQDEMFGIDISDLKDVAISDLGGAIEKKFANISADELRNVNGMNLETEMGEILNKLKGSISITRFGLNLTFDS